MKIRKATEWEKGRWAEAKEPHHLFGNVEVSGTLGGTVSSWWCSLERYGETGLTYELHAPPGMHFKAGMHTLQAATEDDLNELLRDNDLAECVIGCEGIETPLDLAIAQLRASFAPKPGDIVCYPLVPVASTPTTLGATPEGSETIGYTEGRRAED